MPSIAFSEVMLGALEETEKSYVNERGILQARLLFVNNNSDWKAVDNVEEANKLDTREIVWTVAFDGKNLGNIKTKDPNPKNEFEGGWTFPRDKYHLIINPERAPNIKNINKQFGGWMLEPKNRPLVLISKPNYKDPEEWKQFKPTVNYTQQLYPYVKDVIKTAYHCKGAPNWDAVPIEFKHDDLELYKSYRNNKGEMLIAIGIARRHIKDCDGPLRPEDSPNWVFLGKTTKFIGNELELLDAGDYDADNKSEFIFWHSGYNEDGYTLFDKDFTERVDYYWKYH